MLSSKSRKKPECSRQNGLDCRDLTSLPRGALLASVYAQRYSHAKFAANIRKEHDMPKMTGARLLAETVYGYGIRDVFFMPYIAPRALMEMEKLGIKRVQTHGEKSAYVSKSEELSRHLRQAFRSAAGLAAGLMVEFVSVCPVGRPRRIDERGRIRTCNQLIKSQLRCHCATRPFDASVCQHPAGVSSLPRRPPHNRARLNCPFSIIPLYCKGIVPCER